MPSELKMLKDVGGLDLMLMLEELHNRGYGKLRWYSYFSPNGCALRCHILTQDNLLMYTDSLLLYSSEDYCFARSVLSMKHKYDISRLADMFMSEYPRLLAKGKGEDAAYRNWFRGLLDLAKKDLPPTFFGEYSNLPLGKIYVGGKMFQAPPVSVRMVSWNIDDIRVRYFDFKRLVEQYSPDVICLQKVKNTGCSSDYELDGYTLFSSVEPSAGVFTYVKRYLMPYTEKTKEIAVTKGYFLKVKTRYPALSIFNCYVPYSNPDVDGAVRHRVDYDKFIISEVRKTADRIVLCGDLNIVHKAEDCWDGNYERNQANFHDWERKDFEKLLKTGDFVDTYREFNYRTKGFTYFFCNNPKVRASNQGHRIDYFLTSKSLLPQIQVSDIIKDFTTSSNNPIILDMIL
jgi:exodeoxyribonuclease-3